MIRLMSVQTIDAWAQLPQWSRVSLVVTPNLRPESGPLLNWATENLNFSNSTSVAGGTIANLRNLLDW